MPDWFELFIPGGPIPQPRPQIVGVGKPCPTCGKMPFTRVVPGKGKTANLCAKWRKTVANIANAAGELGFYRDTPLAVDLEFRLRPPKSLLRVNGELRGPARKHPTGARDGDWENLAKAPLDALKGILYDDDSRIVDGRATKRWALDGDEPGLLLKWREAT